MKTKIILPIIVMLLSIAIVSATGTCNVCNETCSPCGGGCTATNMTGMFENVTDWSAIGDITQWDTSCVTDMSNMFARATAFNQDISQWNVSSVNNMNNMFDGSSLTTNNYDALLNGWASQSVQHSVTLTAGDIKYSPASAASRDFLINNFGWSITDGGIAPAPEICNICNETCSPCGGGCTATDMTGMFRDVTDWSAIGDITHWNTSCVTNMNSMFLRSAFNQDISGWDTSSVTDMGLMFGSSQSFNQPIGSWNTKSTTNMWSMFWNAVAFDQNISSWNTSIVTDMDGMFDGVALSTTNYDTLLNGWSKNVQLYGIIFNAGNSKYSDAGKAGRDILINAYGWTITDGGMLDLIKPEGTSNIIDGMMINDTYVDAGVYCTDSGSGIDESKTYVRVYNAQNNELSPYSGLIYQLPDGIYHTQYGCSDYSGNTFSSVGDMYGNVFFTVDTTPPYLISTSIVNGMFTPDYNVDLTAYSSDDTSGVNSIYVYLYDSNNVLLYSNNVNQDTLIDSYHLTKDGNYHIVYSIADNAGNTFNSGDINFAIDNIPPIVSFCEGYNQGYSKIADYPYDEAIYNENSLVPQTGCIEDTNFEMMYWSIYNTGYQASYNPDTTGSFVDENGTTVYFVNDSIPATAMFDLGSGQYTLSVSGADGAGNIAEATKTVYYDDTAPEIYYCDSYGGPSPDNNAYLTTGSSFWMALCVYDFTLNNMASYTRDSNDDTIFQANKSWDGINCIDAQCGYASQFNLSEYNFTDGAYYIESEATDRAGHTGFGEIRNFYYDTTPPIYVGSNTENNSIITSLGESISFQFDERTIGSMVAKLYDSDDRYINEFPITNCAYTGINTINGYTDSYISPDGINCSISLTDLGIASNGIYSIIASYTDGVNLTRESDPITFELNCIENWVPDPLMCLEGNQVISYSDTHLCGTTNLLPEDNGKTVESNRCYYSNNTLITDCGNIAESGIYTMNASINANSSNSSNCLTVQANDVILDCAGYGINGDMKGNGFTNITLNSCIVNGSISAIGGSGGADNNSGENGGTFKIYNSNIINIITTGGQGYSIGTGGTGGQVTVYNSNITMIATTGGNGGWEGQGGIGGGVAAYGSDITTIETTGGTGYRHTGGIGGSIIIADSNITTLTVTGGNTHYGGLGGNGGQILITNSSITSQTNITAIGGRGSSVGDEGADGTVIIMNSRIDWNSTINVNDGRLILSQSYFDNDFGRINFNYLNTTKTGFNSIISINNNSAYIDSANYSEYNVPATVTLNITGWNIVIPSIKRNGVVCTNCSIRNYDANSGIIIFDVQGWSNYTITEVDSSPSPAQGSSGGSGSGSSAGGGGANFAGNNFTVSCKENWKCSAWSTCSLHGLQIRTCSDQNSCGLTTEKPPLVQICDSKAYEANIKNPKKALFDIITEIVTEPKKIGEDLIVKISLINFGLTGVVDANLKYKITDDKGIVVKQFSEVVPVSTQTEFLKHVNTSGLMNGKYTLNVELTYPGQIDPANTQKIFYIGGGLLSGIFRNMNLNTIIISLIILLLVAISVFLYIKRRYSSTKDTITKSTATNNNIGNNIENSNTKDITAANKMTKSISQVNSSASQVASSPSQTALPASDNKNEAYARVLQNLKAIAAHNAEIERLNKENKSLKAIEKNKFSRVKTRHNKTKNIDGRKTKELNKYVAEHKKR